VVRDTLNQARKKTGNLWLRISRRSYGAETREEAKEALKNLQKRWDEIYPEIMKR